MYNKWESLPVEVLLEIIQQLPDLGSLGALLHASPAAFRACGPYLRESVEAILASGSICGHTAVLFRLCVLIRSGRLPVDSFGEFYRRVTGEALCYHFRIRESERGIAPRALDEDADPAIVRGLLVTARHVENLAGNCLLFYVEEFKALRPETNPLWVKKSRRRGANPYWFETVNSVAAGTPYKSKDMVGFEWDEVQRAIRAVWRFQLIYELKRAVLRTKILEWKDAEVLESTPAIDGATSFYGKRNDYPGFIWPIRYVVGRVKGRCDFLEIMSPEYEEMKSMTEFIRKQHGRETSSQYQNGLLNISTLGHSTVDLGTTQPPRQKAWKGLIEQSAGVLFYWRVAIRTNPRFRPRSIDYFNQFGFAFWSRIRMQQYGFLANQDRMPVEKAQHAWHSITKAPL